MRDSRATNWKTLAPRSLRWHLRATLVPLCVLVGAGLATTSVHAQRRTHDRVLILTPEPTSPSDSGYVRELVDILRNRLQNKFRHKWQVIKGEQIQELLVSSGFDPNAIIEAGMVGQVAQALQSHGYIYGSFSRNSNTPFATFRLVDVRRSGLSGWMNVQGQPGDPPRAFAERVADSLQNQVKAADFAKECVARRDRSDFRRARQAAERAFQLYPDHPSAAGCVSYVFEATRQPPDSLIWAYEKMTRGDSLNIRAYADLARLYQRTGDTAKAVDAFARQLAANPGNMDMVYSLAAGYIVLKNYERARQVLDEGLAIDPENLKLIGLKGRGCFEGELWVCALEAMTSQYELDSALVGDTMFYGRMFAIAGTVGDTAAVLRWASEGVKYQPNNLRFWRTRAALLQSRGDSAGALEAYHRLVELDSSDVRSTLTVAIALNAEFTVDTLTPLDTAALDQIRGLLEKLRSLSQDTGVVMAVGVEYLKLAQKIVQGQRDLLLGLELAERALEYDWRGVYSATANFWKGYALYLLAYPMDQQILASKSCRQIPLYEQRVLQAIEALTAAQASRLAETANQFLPTLQQLRGRPTTFREAFKCP